MVVIRRGQYLVHDFIAKMRTSEFNLHRNKLIDVTFLMQNENGTQITQELGVGVGPLKDLMSTLVEQFVLNRLSTLFNDGTVEPSLYHFTREECNMEMYLAGQVSGIFDFDINAHPPVKVFTLKQIFFCLRACNGTNFPMSLVDTTIL